MEIVKHTLLYSIDRHVPIIRIYVNRKEKVGKWVD